MNKQEKKKISDALKEIHKLKGDEILQSKKVVLACLKDEIPDMEKKIINLLGFAMDCDVFSVIQSAKENQISKSILSVAKTMEDNYGVDYQISLDIVDAIAVFYGKSDGETVYAKPPEKAPVNGFNFFDFPCAVHGADAESEAVPVMWIPGSGVGYSTHKGLSISLVKMCEDLKWQYAIDFSKQDKIRHPICALYARLYLKNINRIARKWEKCRDDWYAYDAYVIDGAEHLSARKHQKDFKKIARFKRKVGIE